MNIGRIFCCKTLVLVPLKYSLKKEKSLKPSFLITKFTKSIHSNLETPIRIQKIPTIHLCTCYIENSPLLSHPVNYVWSTYITYFV